MIRLDGIHTLYGKSHILHGVSLYVEPGETVCILGRNGVGKTTTLRTLMKLVQPASGRIEFEKRGRHATAIPSDAPPGNRICPPGPPDLSEAHGTGEPRSGRAERGDSTGSHGGRPVVLSGS